MIGYKGFNHNLTCRGNFQYVIGQTYTMNPSKVVLGQSGYHFCQFPTDVFKYYNDHDSTFAIVKAEGTIIYDDDKLVTSQITVLFLLTKEELIKLMSGPIIRKTGTKEWYKQGHLHRLDGPAIEWADGNKEWYKQGQRHRLEGPAIELTNGYRAWYKKGLLHRLDGPAMEYSNGSTFWYQKDELHRLDGPAVELSNGKKEWWFFDSRQPDEIEANVDFFGKKLTLEEYLINL